MDNSPNSSLRQKANKLVSKFKNATISENIAQIWTICNSIWPRFYTLSKIHKEVLMRSIEHRQDFHHRNPFCIVRLHIFWSTFSDLLTERRKASGAPFHQYNILFNRHCNFTFQTFTSIKRSKESIRLLSAQWIAMMLLKVIRSSWYNCSI